MFGKKNTASANQRTAPVKKMAGQDAAVTILTSGCHFNGKLYCRGSSRIGGRIEGQIISEGLLIIESGATIVGEIKAEEAVIQGHVKGKLESSCRIELANTSRVEGDIVTPALVVHEGALFNGRSSMVPLQTAHKNETHEHTNQVIDASTAFGHTSTDIEPDATPSRDIAAMKMPEVNVNN